MVALSGLERSSLTIRPIAATVGLLSILLIESASAALPEPDAWNIGSVLAAAQRCEMGSFLTQGQVTPIMGKFLLAISPTEQQFVKTGYLEGGKREAVYSISRKQWFAVPITAESCKALQYTIDQYKTIINLR